MFNLESNVYDKQKSLADYLGQQQNLKTNSQSIALNDQKLQQGKLERASQYLGMATPDNWQSIRNKAIQEGLGDQSEIPVQFDENWIKQTRNAFSNASTQLSGTESLAQRLMQDNPNLSFTDALFNVQTGFRQGLQRDASGNITPMQGAPEAKGALKYGETSGTERAQLEYAAPTEYAKAQGKAQGEYTAQSTIDVPKIQAQTKETLNVIDSALTAPGFDRNFGKMGILPNIPGGQAADAATYLDQIKGRNFLNAFQSLKGGGQITELEGQKAEQAQARLQKAQSPESARKALQELRDIVISAQTRAEKAPTRFKLDTPINNIPAADDVEGQLNAQVQDPTEGLQGNVSASETVPQRTVVKTMVSPSTGKRKIIYSDGTEEIQ